MCLDPRRVVGADRPLLCDLRLRTAAEEVAPGDRVGGHTLHAVVLPHVLHGKEVVGIDHQLPLVLRQALRLFGVPLGDHVIGRLGVARAPALRQPTEPHTADLSLCPALGIEADGVVPLKRRVHQNRLFVFLVIAERVRHDVASRTVPDRRVMHDRRRAAQNGDGRRCDQHKADRPPLFQPRQLGPCFFPNSLRVRVPAQRNGVFLIVLKQALHRDLQSARLLSVIPSSAPAVRAKGGCGPCWGSYAAPPRSVRRSGCSNTGAEKFPGPPA